MPPNSSLHIVPLDSKSSEFIDVKQKFDSSIQGGYKQIVKIERIQNPALYFQFIGRKKEMDKLNPKVIRMNVHYSMEHQWIHAQKSIKMDLTGALLEKMVII